jgi:phosphate acetyltransferase
MGFRDDLRHRAAARGGRVVLAEGWDERVAEASRAIEGDGLASVDLLDPDVLPRIGEIADLARQRRPDRFADAAEAAAYVANPVVYAVGLVALGAADAAVAGATCPTADVIRAALRLLGPAEGVQTISSAFYMFPPGATDTRGVLTFTDAGIVPDPDPSQLAEIAWAAAMDRRRIVGDEPVVAFLSYSTKGSSTGPRVDKVREGCAAFHALAPGIACDGELQADAALVPEIAHRKAPGSPISGRANVLVFPDLDSGNIAYKLVQRLAGTAAVGPIIQGLAKPVADLSRGASVDDIVDAAAVGLLQAEHGSTIQQEGS